MDGASSPRADHEVGIEISDYATFQTSSPAPHSLSISHASSQRHSLDQAEHEGLSEFSYSSPPRAETHDIPGERYESSTSPSDDEGDDFLNDGNLADHSSSSRSSISSLPASIMPDSDLHDHISPTPSTPQKQTLTRGSFEDRVRGSPFRHTSSVRAMQMNDELTPPSKRRVISSMSGVTDASMGSPRTPSKRSTGTPKKSPTKAVFVREFPLVLLHCRLLAPSLALPTGLKPTDARLLKDLLPEEYFNRWKLLQDRLGGASSTVKERGILIPHPRDDYDLLEERLLESLELVEPRIKDGHFLGCHHDDEEESGHDTETPTGEGKQCQDCGKCLQHAKENRKWEVRCYAKTGLMKEGAWDAAWKEMEKIDVEVGVWIPEEVRREIDRKFAEQAFDVMEDSFLEGESEEQRRRRREIYGGMHPPKARRASQEDAEKPVDDEKADEENKGPEENTNAPEETPADETRDTMNSHIEPDFSEILVNYFKLLARDQKNIVIAILSVLCIYFACSTPSTRTIPPPGVVEIPQAPVLAAECAAPSMFTTTAISVSTKTEFVVQTAVAVETVTDVVAEAVAEVVMDAEDSVHVQEI